MGFNERTVFGLCNVLNRYLPKESVSLERKKLGRSYLEFLARKMDLNFRDGKKSWKVTMTNPDQVISNLTSIEGLYFNLLEELYRVENSVEIELSRDLKKDSFAALRSEIRERYDSLRKPIALMKESINSRSRASLNFESVAAIEAIVVAWRSFKNTKTFPKTLKRRTKLYNFVRDCLNVFEIKDEASRAYSNWHNLTQEKINLIVVDQ